MCLRVGLCVVRDEAERGEEGFGAAHERLLQYW